MTVQEVLNIMTWLEIIIKVICLLCGFATACIITIPSLKKAIKARREAKTAEDKAKADLEIQNQLELFVSTVESSYKNLDAAMKSIGGTAGPLKKDKVLSMLRDFCDSNGYAYDAEALSSKIDNFVRLTKEVNFIEQP